MWGQPPGWVGARTTFIGLDLVALERRGGASAEGAAGVHVGGTRTGGI